MDGRSSQRDLHQVVPRWAFGLGALFFGVLGGVLLRISESGEVAVPLVALAILLGWELVWGGGTEGQSRYRPLVGSAIGAVIAAVAMFVMSGLAPTPDLADEARSMGVFMFVAAGVVVSLTLWTRQRQRRQGTDDVGLFAQATPQQQAHRDQVALTILGLGTGLLGAIALLTALVSQAPVLATLPAVPLLAVAAFCAYKLYRNRRTGPGPW